jgi:hypothetical protein
VISEPRRRTQIKRYGHDETVPDMSELESSSDSDEDGLGRGMRGRLLCPYWCNYQYKVKKCTNNVAMILQVERIRLSLDVLDQSPGLVMIMYQKEK